MKLLGMDFLFRDTVPAEEVRLEGTPLRMRDADGSLEFYAPTPEELEAERRWLESIQRFKDGEREHLFSIRLRLPPSPRRDSI